ncbi:MAG: hypothetical protein L6R39_002498 [Caloplaca ligustica]|nr:MAG: hypothetical protein L6R39_002498 [Caloplaca ligustica]
MPQAQPELKKYLDKRLFVQLNGSRKVIGVLRGYDVRLNHSPISDCSIEDPAQRGPPFVLREVANFACEQVFLNVVLDDAVEEKAGGEKVRLGMVVIRGNSVVMLEALERIGGDQDRR